MQAAVLCVCCGQPATHVVRDGTKPVCPAHAASAVKAGLHVFFITQ